MIEFTVTHTCGHKVTHRFDGPEHQRLRREKWLREQPCQTCFHAQQTATSAQSSEDLGLQPLQGSKDDVAWAEVIRSKAIAQNIDFHKRVNRKPTGDPDKDATAQSIRKATDAKLDQLKSETSAEWWIENRFEVLSAVRRAAVAAVSPILNQPEKD